MEAECAALLERGRYRPWGRRAGTAAPAPPSRAGKDTGRGRRGRKASNFKPWNISLLPAREEEEPGGSTSPQAGGTGGCQHQCHQPGESSSSLWHQERLCAGLSHFPKAPRDCCHINFVTKHGEVFPLEARVRTQHFPPSCVTARQERPGAPRLAQHTLGTPQ